MDRRNFFALLIIATIITTTIITAEAAPLTPATPVANGANVSPTRNLTTAPPNTEWNKTFGGTYEDVAYSIQQTSDAGYIVAGYTWSFGSGSSDFWLVKVDSSGNQQWNKTYGGRVIDEAHSVQQTSDGAYIVAGTTYFFGAGSGDFWLVKVNSSGKMLWNKTYGGHNNEWAYSVQQTSDAGYILAGYTYSISAHSAGFWLVKADSSGSMQWNKTYGGTGGEVAYSVQQTCDGGYIVVGIRSSFGAGNLDFWLVKTAGGGMGQGIPLTIMVVGAAVVAVVVVLVAFVLIRKRKSPA